LGLTTAYVCVAEALGLPMRPVLFEHHVAVGHAGTSPSLHIELTRCGTVVNARRFSLQNGPPVNANDGLLTNRQFLGVHLSNYAAFLLVPVGRLEDACAVLDAAIELFPEYKAAWINKSIVLLELGETQRAEECLRRVARLGPGPRYQIVVDRITERLGRGCSREWASAGRTLGYSRVVRSAFGGF
jgi:tetratricopeptide (TPR) repeat protein